MASYELGILLVGQHKPRNFSVRIGSMSGKIRSGYLPIRNTASSPY